MCLALVLMCGCDTQDKSNTTILEGGNATEQVAYYENITLMCGCTLRVRSALGCTEANFPELCAALGKVYSEAKKHADTMVAVDALEPDGEYEPVTLVCDDCSCALIVYVPDSCLCFDAKYYPELAAALEEVYRLTH
jgi:hypothetical protein